jgi:hypothetical protein
MPIKWFICPDHAQIDIAVCLSEGGCRMGERCATRSYLKLVSKERVWTGKPSTTQLIRGTREVYLTLTVDYAISPDSRAFMAMGTNTHSNLESSTDEYSLLEERFDSEDTKETGISDVIESEGGKNILCDYKNSGSFKVAKALGFKVVERDNGEVYKTGKRKGQPKLSKELVRNIEYEDRREWNIQLNKYRIEYERKFGKKIDNLKIQCIVRDGNTYIARSRGVFRNIYYFNLPIIPDQTILDYFDTKRIDLLSALKNGIIPKECSAEENWNGLKCASYCSVSEHCSYGRYLKQNKLSEDEMIKGLSDVRRLPRLGKIRLGIVVKNDKGIEHPKEIDYFKLDPSTPSELENESLVKEFQDLYGDKPKQIKIMIPLPDVDLFFPQFYKRYGGSVLKCKGDGETASCISKEDAQGLKISGQSDLGVQVVCTGKDCTYYKVNKCSESASLSVLLPELKGAGVWQITTGSFHSIVNINSCLDYIRALCGRFHMIPLTLERREQQINHDGKSSKHYILHISCSVKLEEIQRFATIDSTRILLELPKYEEDKNDILFLENKDINHEPEVVEIITDTQSADLICMLKDRPEILKKHFYEYLSKEFSCKSIEEIPLSKFTQICQDITNMTQNICKYLTN